MSDISIKPDKVKGTDCLDWINKPIGFVAIDGNPQIMYDQFVLQGWWNYGGLMGADTDDNLIRALFYDYIHIARFNHDTNKRIVGYVAEEYDDGGIKVIVLGDEEINQNVQTGSRNVDFYTQQLRFGINQHYNSEGDGMVKDGRVPDYPEVLMEFSMPHTTAFNTWLGDYNLDTTVSMGATLNEMLDWEPPINDYDISHPSKALTDPSGVEISIFTLTNDENTTMVFGRGLKNTLTMHFSSILMSNPLILLSGDLYTAVRTIALQYTTFLPNHFETRQKFENFETYIGPTINSFNLVAIPYNIILTKNLPEAKNYLANGTLPSDAFLYPLDWSDLPRYDIEPDDTPGDDVNDGDDPNNSTGFDGDPDVPTLPSYTPATISNNNYYWIGAGTLEAFINWFWYDVGRWNDFDDLVNTIMGLYNDLGSSILNIRYMPVSNNAYELGGTGTPENIKVGMIERPGAVDTLGGSQAPLVHIGTCKVPKDYKSFASYSPYSEAILYLPFAGYMNIDIDMFTGHDLDVYATYDHLTGTIQYFIMYENKFMVNTCVAKMAVDIPITLQSKNDRDSAIFSNVSSSVGSLMSAGVSIGTGNPIGLVIGANALNTGIHSAPMAVKGTIGETGAFYGSPKCKLITKFPSQQKPSSFDQICGKQLNKTMKLSNSDLKGFLKCYQPRITFSKTTPLKEEIDEIYTLLEEGVIK